MNTNWLKQLCLINPLIILQLASCSDTHEQQPIHNKPDNSITIVAVGDIMLGGTAQEILIEEGYDYPFKHVHPLLADADIVIGNLEGPLTPICNSSMNLDKTMFFDHLLKK